MQIELFIVPDYFCSGVIERYFKVSSVISNGAHEVVLSTIINKKTNALQRQSKIDPPPKIKRTAIYGWDRASKVIVGINGLASEYPNLTDDEKHLLYQCMINLKGAASQAWKKMIFTTTPAVFDQQERTEADRLASEQYREYRDIRSGIAHSAPAPAVETTEESPAVENPPAVETEESPAVETTEESPSTAVVRKSSIVARMVNAHYLTEFVEGNIYGIKENSEINVNGNTYITILNEQGDERQVNKSRIVVESRFDEPPAEE